MNQTPRLEQAQDFFGENQTLFALLENLPEADFARPTQFKEWTIYAILGHLHLWNLAASMTLRDARQFRSFFDQLSQMIAAKGSLRPAEEAWLAQAGESGKTGRERLALWRQGFAETASLYATADPKQRVAWAGPDMSARSKITARLMETWAHGQAIFDGLGEKRTEQDRIKNIVRLGVNTFSWSFQNRGQAVPGPMPYLFLTAPSGVIWRLGEESEANRIAGAAVEFCQTVAQTRNIADTSLKCTGAIAEAWMAQAQCFAGAPETPPPAGTRFCVKV